jgi:hypothetical protein
MSASSRKQVLILGGGFGGLYTALGLERTLARESGVKITLVNRENFSLFTPMLHEVAASDLDMTQDRSSRRVPMNNPTSGCLERAIPMGCLPRKTSLPTSDRLVPRSATRTAGPPPRQLDECIALYAPVELNPQPLSEKASKGHGGCTEKDAILTQIDTKPDMQSY